MGNFLLLLRADLDELAPQGDRGVHVALGGGARQPVTAALQILRHAVAGVMITASHNPPRDNGYKVYLGDGVQIVPPADAQIAACIATVGAVRDVPRADDYDTLGDDIVADIFGDPAEVTVTRAGIQVEACETY